jgi:hypothetical protein
MDKISPAHKLLSCRQPPAMAMIRVSHILAGESIFGQEHCATRVNMQGTYAKSTHCHDMNEKSELLPHDARKPF